MGSETCLGDRKKWNSAIERKPSGARILTVVPVIGMALLPKCPACVMGYLSVLGAIGVSLSVVHLRIGWFACLLVALGSIAVGCHRRGYGPLLLALLATFGILVAELYLGSRLPSLVCVGVFIVAAIWNIARTK